MSQSAKVANQERALELIKKELSNLLQKHLDANKMTPAQNKMKSQLQRKLKETEMKLKEEKKKAEKVEQELEKHRMMECGQADEMCNNILPPKYRNDPE